MPIEDVGYRGWHGRRLNSIFSWLIMVWSGVQVARRSPWVRRALVVAWLPLVYLGAGMFLFENMAADNNWREMDDFQEMFVDSFNAQGSLSTSDFSDQLETEGLAVVRHRMWSWLLASFLAYPQSFCCLLLIGLLAPPLISRDMRSKAFLIYFSKPIGRLEYLAGKFSILALFLTFITFIPAMGLYLFGVFLSPDLSVLWDTWDLPFRVALAAMVFIVPTASVALMFSSLTSESRYAAFAWFAFWGLGFTAWQVIRVSLTQANVQVTYEQQENVRRMIEQETLGGEVPEELEVIMREAAGDLGPFEDGAEIFSRAVSQANESSWSLLSLYDSLVRLQAWILGFNEQMMFPWPQALMTACLTAFAIFIVFRRVSAPIRV